MQYLEQLWVCCAYAVMFAYAIGSYWLDFHNTSDADVNRASEKLDFNLYRRKVKQLRKIWARQARERRLSTISNLSDDGLANVDSE